MRVLLLPEKNLSLFSESMSGFEGENGEMDTARDVSMDQHEALSRWWRENNRAFSLWFLTTLANDEARQQVLLEASPSLPKSPPATRIKAGVALKVTDVLVPELNLEGLLAGGGKLLVMFFARRCVKGHDEAQCGMRQDLKLLNNLHSENRLPRLDQGALDKALNKGIVFVDPVGDPSESIQLMPHSASVEVQQEIADRLSSGTLVEARIFVTMRARREIILTFLIALAEIFEAAVFSSETEPRQHEQERKASNKCGITCKEELGARSALASAREKLKKSVAAVQNALGTGIRFRTALEEQTSERRQVRRELCKSLQTMQQVTNA